MNQLPDRSNLDHLKKQAKDLIRRYRSREPEALARFRRALPAAAGRTDEEIAALDLRLHDAQSCVARDNGFASCADLKRYVEVQSTSRDDRAGRVLHWLELVYSGEIDGTVNRANPRVAVRMLVESPDLAAGSPYLACAIGDEGALRRATAADPAWLDRPGGPLKLLPLVAVTHSSLLQVPEFRDRLHGSARYLLAAGADPEPAGRQPLAARIPEPAARRSAVVRALRRRRTEPRSRAHAAAARCRRRSRRRRIALPRVGKSRLRPPAAGARGARCRNQRALPGVRARQRRCSRAPARARRRSERARGSSAVERLGLAAVVGGPTPALAPAHRGAVARGRRSVGTDAGWHQRLPAGAAARACGGGRASARAGRRRAGLASRAVRRGLCARRRGRGPPHPREPPRSAGRAAGGRSCGRSPI